MNKNTFTYEGKIYKPESKTFGDKTVTSFTMMKSKKNKNGEWDSGFLNMKTWLNFPYPEKTPLVVSGYMDFEFWEKDGKKNSKLVFLVTDIQGQEPEVELKPVGKPEPEKDLPF